MIKRLDLKHVLDIVNLFLESNFKDGYNLDMLNGSFKNSYFFAFGEYDGGKLISFICGTKAVDTFDIEDILVSPKFRRCGKAKELANHLFSKLVSDNVNKVFLEVRESNLSAINLYKSLGFIEINKREKYYSDGETALIFLKEL